MATSTPHLNLSLLSTGESVGTWGIPLNNNFSKIDVLAGEVINARGPESDVNSRFNSVENEIATARGIMPSLAERLNVLLQLDGNIIIEAVPTASSTQIGITRLSINPATALFPIAVGDNDPRNLTLVEHDALTLGGVTHLHKHTLDDDIVDVLATSSEINQALDGIGATVNAGNLNLLTNGASIPVGMHTHPSAGFATLGLIQTSVTPSNISIPIALGENDPRVLSQVEHDALTTGNNTGIHTHLLVDGATDLLVTATVLNQLTGAGTTVTASNLNVLTNLSTTELHDHDNTYYRKTESDMHQTAGYTYSDDAVAAHNVDDTAHAGSNLDLGMITATSVETASAGESLTVRANVADLDDVRKIVLRDKSGVARLYGDALGNFTCENLTINGSSTIVETTTLSQTAILTADLQVAGNTTLGDNNLVDSLVVNCVTSTVNGNLTINGGIALTGLVDGVDVASLFSFATATNSELLAARDGETSLLTKLVTMETIANAAVAEINLARNGQVDLDTRLDLADTTVSTFNGRTDNPHGVTLTQAVLADGGTNVAVTELETLTNGANADSLHAHTINDAEIANARTSSIYGTHATVAIRLDATDVVQNAHETELVNARNGELSLDARLDASDIAGAAYDARVDNPHTVTISQAVTADVGTDITVTELETLTNGTDANALHIHSDYAAVVAEVTTARNLSATLDDRLDAADTIFNALDSEVTTARNGEVSLSAKLTDIEATHAAFIALNSNPHTVTLTQAVTADGGTAVTVAELETLTNGANADALHTHAASDAIIAAASNSSVYGVFADIDGRLEGSEALLNGHTTELVNSRNGEASLDARLDLSDILVNSIDADLTAAKGGYLTLDLRMDAERADALANIAEVTTARNGEASLDVRLDNADTAAAAVSLELTTARNAYPVLDDRLDAADLAFTTLDGEVTTARNAFGSLDARLDSSDTAFTTLSGEVVDARAAFGSVDLRLDANDTIVSGVIGEVTTARNGEVSLDARLDAADVTVAALPQKEVHTHAVSETTWVVTHALNTSDVIVQVYDAVGAFIQNGALVSVTIDTATQVTVVLNAAGTGKVVLIG